MNGRATMWGVFAYVAFFFISVLSADILLAYRFQHRNVVDFHNLGKTLSLSKRDTEKYLRLD